MHPPASKADGVEVCTDGKFAPALLCTGSPPGMSPDTVSIKENKVKYRGG